MLGRTFCVVAALAMGIALAGPVDRAVAQDRAPDNDYWWPDRLNLVAAWTKVMTLDRFDLE